MTWVFEDILLTLFFNETGKKLSHYCDYQSVQSVISSPGLGNILPGGARGRTIIIQVPVVFSSDLFHTRLKSEWSITAGSSPSAAAARVFPIQDLNT